MIAESVKLEPTFIEDYCRLQQQLVQLRAELEKAAPAATTSRESQAEIDDLKRKLQDAESRVVRTAQERDRFQAKAEQHEKDAKLARESSDASEDAIHQLQRDLHAAQSAVRQTQMQLERKTQDHQRSKEEFQEILGKHDQLQRNLEEAREELKRMHGSAGTELEQLRQLQAENPRLKSDLEKCKQKAKEYYEKSQRLQQQVGPLRP